MEAALFDSANIDQVDEDVADTPSCDVHSKDEIICVRSPPVSPLHVDRVRCRDERKREEGEERHFCSSV